MWHASTQTAILYYQITRDCISKLEISLQPPFKLVLALQAFFTSTCIVTRLVVPQVRRASCRKRGRDGTTYSRFHPSNYLSHHLAGIVTAAVFSDAAHIVEEIALLKTRTSGATRTAAAANPIE